MTCGTWKIVRGRDGRTSGHPTYSPTQADVAVADTSRMANNVRPSLARRLVTLPHNYDLARKLLADIRQKRRSQSLDDLVRAATALGFEIDRHRSKDSYIWAAHPRGQKFPIPTTKNPVRVGTATRILRTLEEMLSNVPKADQKSGATTLARPSL